MDDPQAIWEKYGLTHEEWVGLSDEDRGKITGQAWISKPCDICAKPVSVLATHEGPTWCMEHAGTWKDKAK